jgi:GT2 family glycosyltransferase
VPPVAFVVVSWNTATLLDRCLGSLAGAAAAGLADVWVVDNASSDGSLELARERHGWARLIALDENLGFGSAVNLAASRTDNPWLAIANADVALRPGALEALLTAGERDPGAGAIAPRLVLPDGSTQHSVFGFPTVPHTAALASGLFHVSSGLADRLCVPGHWDHERRRRVPWAVAALLLVRRAAWDGIGGFDPVQFMYAEDLDLGWRLRRAGWATRYEPRAVVDHYSGASTSQVWGEDPSARFWRSTYGWMARRRGVARTRTVAAMNALGALARWAVLAPLAAGAREPWTARRRGLLDAARAHASGLAPRRRLEGYR